MRTNDPIWDAERAQIDNRIPIATCEFCNGNIYGEDATHYADTFYYNGDIYCCENCEREFLNLYKLGG